jgi:hypothetical protein
LEQWEQGVRTQLVIISHMAEMSTLEVSPQQGQSAARIERPNTSVLEQGTELEMKERVVR